MRGRGVESVFTHYFYKIGKNVRKCIFIYKNSLRKTKEIENRIFKIIREEKKKDNKLQETSKKNDKLQK